MKQGICEACGKKFEYKGLKRKSACSKACSMKLYRLKNEVEKVCLNPDCGRIFKTTSKGKKFCSGTCKAHYYKTVNSKPERLSKRKLVLHNGLEVRDDVMGQFLFYYYIDNATI
jgi:hypothetical protein